MPTVPAWLGAQGVEIVVNYVCEGLHCMSHTSWVWSQLWPYFLCIPVPFVTYKKAKRYFDGR